MKRMIQYSIAAICLPLAMPTIAAAQDLSYTYLEADYASLDIDGLNEGGSVIDDIDDGDGWRVRSSAGLGANFFVFADYSETNSDVTFQSGTGLLPGDTDINRLDAGIGYRMPLANMEATDLVFRGAYTDIDFGGFDFGGTDDSDVSDLDDDSSDGWFADAGVRSQMFDRFEGLASVRYTDIEEEDQVSLVAEGLFEVTESFGVTLGVEAGDQLRTYFAGVRLSFGGPLYD